MRGNINSCYRVTTLTFLRRNLLAGRQEVINSFRLFRVPKSGLQIIKYFSQRHKLQWLEAGLYGFACFKIFHDTLKSVLVSFNCQMCLLSSVRCFLLEVEKEALWFANLGLVYYRLFKAVAIHGTISGFLQLQFLVVTFFLLNTDLLWPSMLCLMLDMQL